jgi:hypothetical protein
VALRPDQGDLRELPPLVPHGWQMLGRALRYRGKAMNTHHADGWLHKIQGSVGVDTHPGFGGSL